MSPARDITDTAHSGKNTTKTTFKCHEEVLYTPVLEFRGFRGWVMLITPDILMPLPLFRKYYILARAMHIASLAGFFPHFSPVPKIIFCRQVISWWMMMSPARDITDTAHSGKNTTTTTFKCHEEVLYLQPFIQPKRFSP